MTNYKKHIDNATKFIPSWVKVAVALALGMGTMIGWKRIVVTVGEKIGKDHLTYGQGAAAEITAMFTIGAADWFGLPVSTTHVLSSGVAGTMAANHTGLQWSTVRNLAMAWVLTLPGVHHFVSHPVLGLPQLGRLEQPGVGTMRSFAFPGTPISDGGFGTRFPGTRPFVFKSRVADFSDSGESIRKTRARRGWLSLSGVRAVSRNLKAGKGNRPKLPRHTPRRVRILREQGAHICCHRS